MKLNELIGYSDFRKYVPDLIPHVVQEILASSESLKYDALMAFREEYYEAMVRDGLETNPYGLGSEIRNHPQWELQWSEWLPKFAEMKIEEVFEQIMAGATQTNNMVHVYRAIEAGPDWYPNEWRTQPLGIYWSYEFSAAEAHWAHGKHEWHWLIEAEAPIGSIDWHITLLHQIVYEDEREIRLQRGATVLVREIYMKQDYDDQWSLPSEIDPTKPDEFEPVKMKT